MTDQQLDLDAITAMPRAEDIDRLVAEVRRLRAELSAPAAPDVLRAAYIAALDEAHHTHPCPVTGPDWTSCVPPGGRVGSCHSERRADAVLAVRDTELERLRAQRRYLIGQLAKRDARSGDGDRALREFLRPDDTPVLAAADNPTQLRWGLDDVLWGDDGTVTVLLSGPEGEPYWLELDVERAAVLRQNLAGPAEQDRMSDAFSGTKPCGHNDPHEWVEPHTPTPGPKYPFHVCELADAAAQLLGDGWTAKPGRLGTTGTISGPYITSFDVHVDHDSKELTIDYDTYVADKFPELEVNELPVGVGACPGGVYLNNAEAEDGLEALATRVANAIRHITGRPLV
ncbi:hypothetical protein [Streptomyces botrytidirepellens]|uniref:Uncharacterized protein n=1 Tax=Streptomyces botrytidirepellens TaxID=2486417 RepID=A0A3M8W7S9_9ACTN|nr:hypothetical protein [Streptomyces botrytidirepellens]RNG26158.1 hypothetical protein EEJ42_15980 [Streptomyces botrytidirepellens]